MSTPFIPAELLERAYYAPNGELAWTRPDAIAVAKILAAAGLVILGGEIWLTLGNGAWTGLIPQADGGPPGVYHWEFEPFAREVTETWRAFCTRAAVYTIEVLQDIPVEDEVLAELLHRLRCNLCSVTQEEYEELPWQD